MRLELTHGEHAENDYWDADSTPTRVLRVAAHADTPVIVDKFVAVHVAGCACQSTPGNDARERPCHSRLADRAERDVRRLANQMGPHQCDR